eukprot:m.969962 g.969962  ORF g.969962 m.969962 type:complete len:95 (+) comp23922_c1_seq2:1221-1505(+)
MHLYQYVSHGRYAPREMAQWTGTGSARQPTVHHCSRLHNIPVSIGISTLLWMRGSLTKVCPQRSSGGRKWQHIIRSGVNGPGTQGRSQDTSGHV